MAKRKEKPAPAQVPTPAAVQRRTRGPKRTDRQRALDLADQLFALVDRVPLADIEELERQRRHACDQLVSLRTWLGNLADIVEPAGPVGRLTQIAPGHHGRYRGLAGRPLRVHTVYPVGKLKMCEVDCGGVLIPGILLAHLEPYLPAVVRDDAAADDEAA